MANAHKYDTHTLVHNVRISTGLHSMIIKGTVWVGVWTECQLSKGVECHSAFFLQIIKQYEPVKILRCVPEKKKKRPKNKRKKMSQKKKKKKTREKHTSETVNHSKECDSLIGDHSSVDCVSLAQNT